MVNKNLTVLGGVVIWIILVGVSIFVFVVAFILLFSIRSKSLKHLEKSVMEPKLRTTSQDLGKMEPFIADIWDRRSTVHPIPQINHFADGFINIESGVISIRNEICESLKKIEEAAAEFDPKYARKSSLTAQEYILWLKDQEGITIPVEAAQAYIDFYNNARYGSHAVEFTSEDYTFFSTHLHNLINGIPPPNDQGPLTPATTILQRRQKSLNQ